MRLRGDSLVLDEKYQLVILGDSDPGYLLVYSSDTKSTGQAPEVGISLSLLELLLFTFLPIISYGNSLVC